MGYTPERLYPWRPDLLTALNCGVVGFRNPDQAVEYASLATTICLAMTPYLDEFDKTIPAKKRMGTAMVVPEQYFLKCYANAKNLTTAYVSTKMARGVPTDYHPEDYYHAMGSKNDPEVRKKFRNYVSKSLPDLYRAIITSAYGGL